MQLPRIAIVGRPNVGKSSLLNMIARTNAAIVDPTPGVTRDRVSVLAELYGPLRTEPARLVEIIDTGGYGVYTADGARFDDIGEDLSILNALIEEQIAEATRTADIVLLVIDAQVGVTPLDQTIAQLLREASLGADRRDRSANARAPGLIRIVANKTDSESWEPHAADAASLGFGEPLLISALNAFRRRTFLEALYEALPDLQEGESPPAQAEMKVAIVGKRNAGKSTFVNALAGEERVIVSEIAGTTRDAVDVRFTMGDRTFLAIDTAGLRKKKSLADRIEWRALDLALRSVRRADVVLFLLDAASDVSQVDKNLGMEISAHFKPCIIVVNKWDLADGRRGAGGKPVTTEVYRDYLDKQLRGLRSCPIVFTTAIQGEGVERSINVALELFEQSRQRVTTGQLNRIMRDILNTRGPSSKLGTQAKIFYVSQVSVSPPTIVMIVNNESLFGPQYRRFLLNRLAEVTPFDEVPIRLLIRERRRVNLEELLARDGGSAAEVDTSP